MRQEMMRIRIKTIIIFCILVFVDQISKFIILNHLNSGLFFLNNFLGLELQQNYGFAFGVELGNIASIVLTIVVLGLFLYLFFCHFKYHKCHPERPAKDPEDNASIRGYSSLAQNDRGRYYSCEGRNFIPLLLVISGAASNLIDRGFRGYVVDFIRVSPILILNLADIFILAGLVILFVKMKEKKGLDEIFAGEDCLKERKLSDN